MKKLVALVMVLSLGLFCAVGCSKPAPKAKTPAATPEAKADAAKPDEKAAPAPKADEAKEAPKPEEKKAK
jgi:hypothetical protein